MGTSHFSFSSPVVYSFSTFGLFIPFPSYLAVFQFCNLILALPFSWTDLPMSLPSRSTYLSRLNFKGVSFLKSSLLLSLKMTSSFLNSLWLLIHNPWNLLILLCISYRYIFCIRSKRMLKIEAFVLYIFMSSPKPVHCKWWEVNPGNIVKFCHLSTSRKMTMLISLSLSLYIYIYLFQGIIKSKGDIISKTV